MMWSTGMGVTGWILMTLTAIAFWALVVFGIVALFRGSRDGFSAREAGRDRDAEHILDERFARGEIDAEEYRARQAVLHPGHSGRP